VEQVKYFAVVIALSEDGAVLGNKISSNVPIEDPFLFKLLRKQIEAHPHADQQWSVMAMRTEDAQEAQELYDALPGERITPDAAQAIAESMGAEWVDRSTLH
jgi:hypothetical protein